MGYAEQKYPVHLHTSLSAQHMASLQLWDHRYQAQLVSGSLIDPSCLWYCGGNRGVRHREPQPWGRLDRSQWHEGVWDYSRGKPEAFCSQGGCPCPHPCTPTHASHHPPTLLELLREAVPSEPFHGVSFLPN